MSSVDKRVVQMDFDDSRFQEGAKRAAQTLGDLDNKLVLKNGTKGLEQVQNTVNSFNMSNMNDQIEQTSSGIVGFGKKALSVFGSIASKAATVAKVGIGAFSGIATVIGGMAIKGGLSRAKNLEQANFQLNALLKNSSKVKAVMDDVNYAVDGTRFGLDAAAKAAGQLVASNVKAGDEMKAALRGISGVAAMTNSEYEDISRIFTRVAGNGRMFAVDLNSIAARGLNAASAIAKYLNRHEDARKEILSSAKTGKKALEGISKSGKVTEATIRDLTSKGAIDFKTFSNAMDEAFGESATKANETFQGALANTKAALSRIGAEIMIPGIENARKVLVETIPALNQIKKSLVGVGDTQVEVYKKNKDNKKEWEEISKEVEKHGSYVDKLGNYYTKSGKVITKTSEKMIKEPVEKASKKIRNEIKKNGEYVDEFGNKFYKENGKIYKEYHKQSVFRLINEQIAKASEKLSSFLSKLTEGGVTSKLTSYMKSFTNVFEGIKNIFDTIGILLSPFKDAIKEAFSPLFETAGLEKSTASFLEFTKALKEGAADSELFKNVITPLAKVFGDFLKVVVSLASSGASKIGEFFNNLIGGGDSAEKVEGQANTIFGIFDKINGFLKSFDSGEKGSPFDKLRDSVTGFTDALKGINAGEVVGGAAIAGLTLVIFRFIKALLAFPKAITSFSNGIKAIPRMISSIPQSIDKLAGAFSLFSKGAVILMAAIAIRLVADSLIILASVPFENLVKGTFGVALLMGVLIGMAKAVDALDIEKPMVKVAKSLIKLSVALLIVSAAIRIIGGMEWESLAKAGAALLGLVAIITILSEVVDVNYKALKKTGKIFGEIGFALLGFVGTLKLLGNMEWEELGRGLLGLTALVALCLGVAAVTKVIKGSSMIKLATGLLILAAAMLVLVPAIYVLSTIPFDAMFISMAAFAAGMTLIGLAGSVVEKGAVGLIVFAAATAVFGLGLLAVSAATLIFATSLGIIIATLQSLANQEADVGKIVLIILQLSVALLAMLPAALIMGVIAAASILLAAALVIGAAGLTAFALALGVLLSLDFSNFSTQMQQFAEGLAALEPHILTIMALSVAMIILSAAMLVATIPILAFVAALSLLQFIDLEAVGNALIAGSAKFVEVGVAILTNLANGITQHKEEIKTAIHDLIYSIADIVVSMAGDLLSIGKDIVGGILGGMLDAIGLGGVAEAVGGFVDGIASAVSDWLPFGKQQGAQIVQSQTEGIQQEAPKAEEAAGGVTEGILGKVTEAIPGIGDGATGMGDMLGGNFQSALDGFDFSGMTDSKIGDITKSIDTGKDKVQKKSGSIGTAISNGAAKNIKSDKMKTKTNKAVDETVSAGKKRASKAKDIGKEVTSKASEGADKSKAQTAGSNVGQGLIDGINGKSGSAATAAYSIGATVIREMKRGAAVKSPSRAARETGQYIDEGLVLGMLALQSRVNSTGYQVGYAAVNAMSLAVESASNMLDDIDTDPVIRPIVDLTDLEAGVARANGLFPSSTTFQAGAAGRAYAMMANAQNGGSNTTNNYSIRLDYTAGDTANDMVRGITQAIKARELMEG